MNRTEKDLSNNTDIPKPTTKKRFLRLLWLLFTALLIFVPVYGLKKYELKILSFQAAPQSATADCGVVLTGGAGRIREGISLLSQKHIHKLIISGVHQRSTLADMFPEILFYPEIELEDVVLERRSSSTAGNAQQSLAVAEALQCHSILLITSDYHLYRAYRTFKQIFPATLRVIPYATGSDRLRHHRRLFLDTRYWGIIFEEWYKYLFYSVFVF